GERLERWQRGRLGNAAIIIGTRSAVFAPLAKLGLIVVDEEHDGSYKQQDGFRYSARDIAVKRAQLEDCPVLLGSATPSLESVSNCQRGRYVRHRLRERQGGGALPILQTIDLRGQNLQSGISDALLVALRETIAAGKQALLFLNRRGYAPTLQCHDCGWIAGCEHCDTRLTVHLKHRQLLCHHCGFRRKLMNTCDDCGSRALLAKGLGTEQLDSFLSEQLHCPIHRIDSDNAKGRTAAEKFAQLREDPCPCVIIGTQMLTKGHHFPHVQLVGIVDTDALLHGTDFRGPERMAQLVTQVAGRAGREQVGGLVLLQTHYPDDPLLAMLLKQEYEQLSEKLLSTRERQKLPPCGHLFMLRTDSKHENDGEVLLSSVKREALPLIPRSCQIIGPLPSALPRRAGRFRHQIWCMSPVRGDAQLALSTLIACAENHKRSAHTNWFVDVDPQEVV
ncbi:MAG: primosomal protein N', partial [Pseudomonadota bacterium]